MSPPRSLVFLLFALLAPAAILGCYRTATKAPPRPELPSGLLVHDPDTGRTWTSLSPTHMGWDHAQTYCGQLPPTGQWRLPLRPELEAQFGAEGLRAPFLPAPDSVLFSGEVVPGRESNHIWVANPVNGHVFNGQGREGYVRCVRAADPYTEQQLAQEAADRWKAGVETADTSSLTTVNAHVMGRENAPVTVWYFYDFSCPYCARAHVTMQDLVEGNRQVRVVYKAAPILTFHPNSEQAHWAAFAAGRQGRYWEMTELLFEHIRRFQSEPDAVAAELAAQLGLDQGRFETDYYSAEVAAQVASELAETRSVGIKALPTTFVGDQIISGSRPLEDFQAAVDAAGK